MRIPVLSIIVFLPLVGAAACAFLPRTWPHAPRWVAASISALDLAAVALLVYRFVPGAGRQFVVHAPWVPQANIFYYLGVDGISLPMVVLSALLTFLAVIASWKVEKRPALYFAMLMLLEVAMNGVFLALDLVLFYLFWELVLIPMYFLIAQWGGPRREYAAIKFFLYTLSGSVFMLLGIVSMYLNTGSFDMVRLIGLGAVLSPSVQWWIFLLFFLGFAVKVPIWPLHTWLPDAHVEAPTAASAILAGVLLKMGTYGFLRISLPMLPNAFHAWQWTLGILAMISIVYGAAVAFAQTDLKKLVAYSSVSHMGFAMLGIASGTVIGLNGAIAVEFSHGLVAGMLFLLVGVVYERAHTREIAKLSGVAGKMPIFAGLFAFASVASMGLPGLSGFVGEFLSLLGSWQSALPRWVIVCASLGVLLGAAYMLWMIQRVLLGEPSEVIAKCDDASTREILLVLPLAVLVVAVGLDWDMLLRFTNPAALALSKLLGGS